MLTVKEILDLILANSDDYDLFGLRVDRDGLVAGTILPNSHQWWQDYKREEWGELPDPMDRNSNPEHPYNPENGCWDDGELPGVCCVEVVGGYWAKEENVVRALGLMDGYRYKGHKVMYLIGGNRSWGGEDIDEIIIEDGTVLAVVG